MSDQANISTADKTAEDVSDRKAIETLATLFGASMKKVAGANESQQIAILALTAVVALSPATADIDPKRLAVVLEMLTKGRPDSEKVRKRVANYVGLLVGISRKLPELLAGLERSAQVDPAPKDIN
jgi:hypothetical protein